VSVGDAQVRAGGDVIVAIAGQPMTTDGELRGYVENHTHPGEQVALTILRAGQRQEVVETLSERPS
jgi:S1-C subfamily serine protease